ncbi:hypothetical protein OsccyDRAFT_0744 [Leptolyngbyaceae cyanobacterium JSC-12]|nr:hypothetical protein OsccyDRAFT_0744 [Leptolyngbyaceae cyanobacterium JSC-12]
MRETLLIEEYTEQINQLKAIEVRLRSQQEELIKNLQGCVFAQIWFEARLADLQIERDEKVQQAAQASETDDFQTVRDKVRADSTSLISSIPEVVAPNSFITSYE